MTPTTLDKHHIFQLLAHHRNQLAVFGLRKIGLFGSFARGEQTAESDIDLLAEFEPEKETFRNFMKAVFFLEEILDRKVELITPAALSPYIGPHILKEVENVPLAA